MRLSKETRRTRTARIRRVSAVAVLVVAVGTAVAGSATRAPADPIQVSPAPTISAAPTSRMTLTALGDSIPAAVNCPGCAPFVELFARQLATRDRAPIEVTNLGVSGWTSDDLLDALAPDGDDAATVRDSDILTITIGANDFAPQLESYVNGTCGDDDQLSCFEADMADLETNLRQVLARVTDLRSGRTSGVFVTGYWDVFPDGEVAEQMYGRQFLSDSATLTQRANAVIDKVATDAHETYVDLFGPFKGTAGSYDPIELLADDGDHPNQAGHQKISDALTLASARQEP